MMSKNPQEKAPLSELMVEKTSGNSEKFDEEKLVRGISRAGTPVPTCQRYFKINH